MFDFEYVGNVHIHSILSDGTGTYDEIAEKAVAAGLDFICFNDHDSMKGPLNLEDEGFFGKMPVLIGLEIGSRDHHYLAFDVKGNIPSEGLSPQDVIDEVKRQGGIGFLAHPFEKGMPYHDNSRAFTWNDLSVKGFTGVCIWNFSSRWKERVKSVLHALFLIRFRSQALKGPSHKTMAYYDDLCQSRRVVAIGGSDAHGVVFKWRRFHVRPLPYEFLFKTINIHVLLKRRIFKDFANAKEDIHEAMSEGRLFIANDDIFPAKGFRFNYVSDDGSDLNMGEEGTFFPGHLIVESPSKGEIRLYKNGRLMARRRGAEAVFRVKQKGVYRVEVYRYVTFFGWRPWIFTNPIYLR